MALRGRLVDEHDVARHAVAGPLGAHHRPDLVGVDRVPGPHGDEGGQALPEVGVGHPDDRDLAHRRVLDEERLDLAGVDVLAAADDHVVVSPRHEVEPVSHRAHVTGGDEAVEALLGAAVRVAVEDELVAGEDPPRLPGVTSRPSSSRTRTRVPSGGVPAVSGSRRRSCGVAMHTHEASVDP